MLTEVEIMQTRAPVERPTGLVSCSKHLIYIMNGAKEHFRYKKSHAENKGLGSACAGAPLLTLDISSRMFSEILNLVHEGDSSTQQLEIIYINKGADNIWQSTHKRLVERYDKQPLPFYLALGRLSPT